MSDIFLSYAHEDKPKAKILADALDGLKWSVWWDRNIPPGVTWAEHIENAIEQSKCVIVLWSKTSSESDWVNKEARYGENRKILIPVLIEETKIPFEFEHLQAADLSNWDGSTPHAAFDELVNAVGGKLGRTVTIAEAGLEEPEARTSRPPRTDTKSGGRKKAIGMTAAAVVLIAAVMATWTLLDNPQLSETLPKSDLVPENSQADEPRTKNATKGSRPIYAYLDYSTDMRRWGISYFRPTSIGLFKNSPSKDWVEPSKDGRQRLYGTLTLAGSYQVGVILDIIDSNETRTFFSYDEDNDFSKQPGYLWVRGSRPETAELQISYPDGIRQRYALAASYNYDVSKRSHRLQYFRASVRQGMVEIGKINYPMAIVDENTDGMYSDLENTTIVFDLDGDAKIAKNERFAAASAFALDGTYYRVSEITNSGSRTTIVPARFGKIAGRVVDAAAKIPVGGASITLMPNDLKAVTDPDGHFHIEAPEGRYRQLSATAEGFVPNYVRLNKEVAAGQSLNLDPVPLTSDASASARSGLIRLKRGDSYHFLSGERHHYSGGDFYLTFSDNQAFFFANNRNQQGLKDLGNLKNKPLSQVEPPASGYYKFGVPAVEGHTYVSPAKKGEEGHFIIFRVTRLKLDDFVEIEFIYR